MTRTTTGTRVGLDGLVQTSWTRLASIAKRRLRFLGISQPAMQAKGGPSVSWLTKLPEQTGAPSERQEGTLLLLDRALNWPDGTSLGVIVDDRDGWDAARLADEEEALVHMADQIRANMWVIEQRLRAMPPKVADEMIDAIYRITGAPLRE